MLPPVRVDESTSFKPANGHGAALSSLAPGVRIGFVRFGEEQIADCEHQVTRTAITD